jgi:MoxR-like ATPase
MSKTTKHSRFAQFERVELEGKMVRVPYPTRIPREKIVEREDLQHRCLAAWLSVDRQPPLNFRIYGPPGCGKNALVYSLARHLDLDLYVINGHQELGPEDIACTVTMASNQSIEYVASPLFAAMYRGGICFFDEIGKAPTSALDPLASVLDDRRTLTSVQAGLHLQGHPQFLFCAALNQDEEEGLGLPGFIDERTRPAIQVDYPAREVMERILRANLPRTEDIWFQVFYECFPEAISPRSAVTMLRYACSLARVEKNSSPTAPQVEAYLERAHRDVKPHVKREVS